MSEGTFTPGPWSVPHFAKPEVGCNCGYVLSAQYMGAVCTVHASGEGGCIETGDNPKFDEACANARLIAAAPDLLEACEVALARIESDIESDSRTTLEGDQLRAAIAAARSGGA